MPSWTFELQHIWVSQSISQFAYKHNEPNQDEFDERNKSICVFKRRDNLESDAFTKPWNMKQSTRD